MFRLIRTGNEVSRDAPSTGRVRTIKNAALGQKNHVFTGGMALAMAAVTGCATNSVSQPAPASIASETVAAPSPESSADSATGVGDGLVTSVPSEADLVSLAGGISDPASVFGSPVRAPDLEIASPNGQEGGDATVLSTASVDEMTVEPATAEFIPTNPDVPLMESRPDLEKIATALRDMAAEADDPVPYHLAESILPLLGVKGLTSSTLGDFEYPEEDLDGAEASMLEEVSVFSATVRARLDGGEPTRSVLIEELERLLDRLERGSRLTIAVAELCSEVRGAGDYELLPRVFASGRDQEVLVYIDLDGEDWSEADGGQWAWAVEWQLELHQIADQSIPHQTKWSRQEIKRAYPVDDNYLLIRYTIPAEDLASALYTLKIRVREPGTRRETERSIQFQLVPRSTIGRG
jgi:hypothetical protein